jgi:hypothetical protein
LTIRTGCQRTEKSSGWLFDEAAGTSVAQRGIQSALNRTLANRIVKLPRQATAIVDERIPKSA